MKKILCFALMAMLVAACSTPEKKAEALIKDYLKLSLLKPETYKPVKTILREANSPNDDLDLLKEVKQLQDIAMKYDLAEDEVRRAKNLMALSSGPYQSAFAKNNYEEAKEDFDKANAKIEELRTKGKKMYDDVVTKLKSTPELVGYKALHNFRADDNNGNTYIGNVVAFFDKDMERVTYVFEMDEYDALQKYIKEEILKEE